MAEPLIVVGASGFGRETLDVAEAINAAAALPRWDLIGVVDDKPSEVNLLRLKDRGVPYLGTVDDLRDFADARVAVGIGNPAVRAAVVSRMGNRPLEPARLIHPRAVLGSRASVGSGAVICAGVIVGTNVELGQHVHLNPHAVIGHDTRLGDFVSVNPNATVSGECEIETGVLVGAAATVLQGLRVGAGATVGAAACVTRSVAAGLKVRGVPAR